MLISRFCSSMVTVCIGVLGSAAVCCQDFPNRPVRLITPEPGGGADFAGRLIAQGLSANVGQQVIVDNRGGGSGAIAAQAVAKAPPDGYTLLVYGGTFWLGPLLRDKTPYDPVKDFAPITAAVTSPQVLVVHPSLPVQSVKDLIALAKARPGQLNYSSASPGSANHLAGELFKTMADVNIVLINYKGTGPAVGALVAGEVQLMFPNAPSAAPHVKSGRLKVLAVASVQPSALVPGVPTIAATVPGFESAQIIGVFAPAKTPDAVVRRLNQEIVRVLNQADVKEKFFNTGAETVGSSAEELGATMKSEIARMGKVIKDARIRVE